MTPCALELAPYSVTFPVNPWPGEFCFAKYPGQAVFGAFTILCALVLFVIGALEFPVSNFMMRIYIAAHCMFNMFIGAVAVPVGLAVPEWTLVSWTVGSFILFAWIASFKLVIVNILCNALSSDHITVLGGPRRAAAMLAMDVLSFALIFVGGLGAVATRQSSLDLATAFWRAHCVGLALETAWTAGALTSFFHRLPEHFKVLEQMNSDPGTSRAKANQEVMRRIWVAKWSAFSVACLAPMLFMCLAVFLPMTWFFYQISYFEGVFCSAIFIYLFTSPAHRERQFYWFTCGGCCLPSTRSSTSTRGVSSPPRPAAAVRMTLETVVSLHEPEDGDVETPLPVAKKGAATFYKFKSAAKPAAAGVASSLASLDVQSVAQVDNTEDLMNLHHKKVAKGMVRVPSFWNRLAELVAGASPDGRGEDGSSPKAHGPNSPKLDSSPKSPAQATRKTRDVSKVERVWSEFDGSEG